MQRPKAFLSGASSSIGASIALSLADAGYDLALSSRSVERLADLSKQVEERGARVVCVAMDLTDLDSIRPAFQAAVSGLGGMDVLINNAGLIRRAPALDVSYEEWDELMRANLTGSFFLSQEMGRHLVAEGKPGQIVNVASTHGLIALSERSVYGIAKAGLIHMTRALALEWADHGIRVNAVAPATIDTPSRTSVISDPKIREQMLARIPMRRFGTPDEVAAAVMYLVSDGAGFVTGHTIVLDGGLSIW